MLKPGILTFSYLIFNSCDMVWVTVSFICVFFAWLLSYLIISLLLWQNLALTKVKVS